jgi:hypothetical protein
MSQLTLNEKSSLFALILRFTKIKRDEAWNIAEQATRLERGYIWAMYWKENYEEVRKAIEELRTK